MAWLKKWWLFIGVSVVVILGGVAAVFKGKPKSKDSDFDDLINQQKELKNEHLNDVSERLEDAQDDLEEVEKSAQYKVLETEKGDYSDAKSAVDSFNND